MKKKGLLNRWQWAGLALFLVTLVGLSAAALRATDQPARPQPSLQAPVLEPQPRNSLWYITKSPYSGRCIEVYERSPASAGKFHFQAWEVACP